MASGRSKDPIEILPEPGPARTSEEREQQLIALAMDLAEQRIRKGSATSQEVTHFLKLGSSREKLEQRRLEVDTELQRAKVAAIESQAKIEELYGEAIAAMRTYSGQEPLDNLSEEEPFDVY